MEKSRVPKSLRRHFENDFVTSPVLESLYLGSLPLPSGRLVICDPLLTVDMPSLDIEIRPGSYPIHLHIERETGCVAYAELVICPGQRVDTWAMACLPGQEVSELKEGEIYGFSVESGLAMMMDEEAQRALNEEEQRLFDQKGEAFCGLYTEVLEGAFCIGNQEYSPWAMVEVGGHKMAGFAAGYGTGFYSSWVGYSASKEVIKIVCELVEIG